MATDALFAVVDKIDRSLKALTDHPSYLTSRDFCATVRECFYAVYAEYQLNPNRVSAETHDTIYQKIVVGQGIMKTLLVADDETLLEDGEGAERVSMWAESIDFRRQMMELLRQSGPEAVCRRQVGEIRMHSSVPYRMDAKKETTPLTRLLSDIAVEMYKDHGPSVHALETFAGLLSRFMRVDLPRLELKDPSQHIEKTINQIEGRLRKKPGGEVQARHTLETEADKLCSLVMQTVDLEPFNPIIFKARDVAMQSLESREFLVAHGGKTVVFLGEQLMGEGDTNQEAYANAIKAAANAGVKITAEKLLFIDVPPLTNSAH
jgi:hypothetical protein